MPIRKDQYDKIIDEYSVRRARAIEDRDRVLRQLRIKIPEFAALEDRSTDVAADFARRYIEDPTLPIEEMDSELSALKNKREKLLADHGYDPACLEPHFTCPDCEDTGFIGNEKCHCLKQRELECLYDNSNLRRIIRDENFSTLREDLFSGEDLVHFRAAVSICHEFVNSFDREYANLMFYGTVGTGKTFLCNCIAGELLNSGHSVIYLSAADFFKIYGDLMYGKRSREDEAVDTELNDLYDCDLLVLDDVGTEMPGQFTSSAMFNCMNNRHTRHRSTIINTNLSLSELQERYSDRVFTRLTGFYRVLKLTGPDLRIRLREKFTAADNK